MNWQDFHFLRPGWLLAILPLLGLWYALRQRGTARSGAWDAQCDAHLRPHVLIGPSGPQDAWPWRLLAVAWLLAVLALAGPTWEKLPLPAYRVDEARVIALDLSRSMDAADLVPSRLARAKFKVLDLLTRTREGQTALVVFAAGAYVLAPLSDDANTLAALVPPLSTDMIPTQGSQVNQAIAKSAELLSNTGLRHGEIIIVTDGTAAPAAALDAARDARSAGFRISVLGVGTTEGAPIPLAGGGFLKDAAGNVVVPKLEEIPLAEIARQGGGRYHNLSPDDRDLDALLPPSGAGAARADGSGQIQLTDHWLEVGPWLVVLLLPLASLALRRGWLGALLCVCLLQPDLSYAAPWPDWWWHRDQQAAQALDEGDPTRAAELFEDPLWRGAALYRAGHFDEALAALADNDDALAHYNRGNALAQLGRYAEALAAYEAALERAPGDEDAQFNRKLMQDLLAQTKQDNPQAGGSDQSERQSGGDKNRNQSQQHPSSSQANGTGDEAGGDSINRHDTGEEQSGTTHRSDDPQQHHARGKSPDGNDGQGKSSEQPAADGAQGTGKTSSGNKQSADNRRGEAQGAEGDSIAGPGQDGDPGTSAGGDTESQQALEQWLRRVPDDPGGLLRRKLLRDHQQQAGTGNSQQAW